MLYLPEIGLRLLIAVKERHCANRSYKRFLLIRLPERVIR